MKLVQCKTERIALMELNIYFTSFMVYLMTLSLSPSHGVIRKLRIRKDVAMMQSQPNSKQLPDGTEENH
jgi:hypothetical protein